MMYGSTGGGYGNSYARSSVPVVYHFSEAVQSSFISVGDAPSSLFSGSLYGLPGASYGLVGDEISSVDVTDIASRKQTQTEPIGPFVPDLFLHGTSPLFVGGAQEIQHLIEETYLAVTGSSLPRNTAIVIGSGQELAQHYPGRFSPQIAGFALNRGAGKLNEVFVREGTMDQVLLTLGHELGHVESTSLPSLLDEEAKAYAFSLAWIKAIRTHNIGGLAPLVTLNPAQNGVHDRALAFVLRQMTFGVEPLTLFHQLAAGLTHVVSVFHPEANI